MPFQKTEDLNPSHVTSGNCKDTVLMEEKPPQKSLRKPERLRGAIAYNLGNGVFREIAAKKNPIHSFSHPPIQCLLLGPYL
ncbi:MAG: hypothetical protein MJA27_27525 [Pseudanabaenales cyanobacterium]|nr:hypothetical protein [Pseudanabaenales cyanobacterium]